MHKKIIILIFTAILLTGCTTSRVVTHVVADMSDQEIKTMTDVDKIKTDMGKTCGYQTAMVRALMGNDYEYKLPQAYIDAAEEADAKCQALFPEEFKKNQEMGSYIGSRARMQWYAIKYVKKEIQDMMPEFIKLFDKYFGGM